MEIYKCVHVNRHVLYYIIIILACGHLLQINAVNDHICILDSKGKLIQ